MSIACAFKGVIASIGVSLLGVTHPLWENISSAEYTPVDDSHLGREVEERRPMAVKGDWTVWYRDTRYPQVILTLASQLGVKV